MWLVMLYIVWWLLVAVALIIWFLSSIAVLVESLFMGGKEEKAWENVYKIRDCGNAKTDTATFVLPGFFQPSLDKLQPYIDSLPGNVYLCDYSEMFWSEKVLADRILEIICSNPYKKVELLSFSFGCKVAYNLTTFSGITEHVEIKSIMVCPMPRGKMVRKRLRLPMMIGLPLITPVVVLLSGRLLNVRFIKIHGVSYSLLELLTRAFSMVYDARPCILGMREDKDEIVVSTHDNVVDNAEVYGALGHRDFKIINGDFSHGDIGDDLCYFAVQRAGAFDDF